MTTNTRRVVLGGTGVLVVGLLAGGVAYWQDGFPVLVAQPAPDELLVRAPAGRAGGGEVQQLVEIETYTWDVLPSAARGPGALVDDLEREYHHVTTRLAAASPADTEACTAPVSPTTLIVT